MNNDNAIIHLRTKHDVMWVNVQGQIFTQQAPNPDDSWHLCGAVEYGRGCLRHTVIRQYPIWDIMGNQVPWFYKNGKQRCFVLDRDHGSRRVQMSPPLVAVWLKSFGYVSGSYGG
jgi:hypothetical protein